MKSLNDIIVNKSNSEKSYVGESGRGLQIRLQEHKRACSIGLQNSAVANHALDLDHRIDFKNTKLVYKDSDIGRRRVVEGAIIHSVSTFEIINLLTRKTISLVV